MSDRLISADSLWMTIIHAMDYCEDIFEFIEKEPEAVVRCKDCEHWHESIFLRGEQGQRVGLCDCTMSMRDTDFFCKAGERRKDGR